MQGEIPREVKDIIRNVQEMDLPENGIADIRIKIQGGDVMDRPMFKKGGGANKFPDLSGDGKVTQKDILIGRGVIEKQEGGAVLGGIERGLKLAAGPFGGSGYDIMTSLVRDPETNELVSKNEFDAKYPPAALDEKMMFEKIKEAGGAVLGGIERGLKAATGFGNFQSDYLGGNKESQDKYFDLLFQEYFKAVEKGPEETLRFISETKMPREFRKGFLQMSEQEFGKKPKDMAEGGAVNPEQAVAQVEMAAEAEGEKLGLDYLASQMGGIDMAEDAEGLINALRGNEMPISARRTELAEYVGEEDAMRTPESVLAMVQPTIMMTEEGAMNSGIGELMQQLTSDVEMATEGGAPTDMGQGVGALMMAGSPQEQPVQQFAAGGQVVRMRVGGDPFQPFDLSAKIDETVAGLGQDYTVDDLLGNEELRGLLAREALTEREVESAEDAAARFETLMTQAADIGGSDEARRRQTALDLAQAGFAFASGVDPRTGQSIAGRPVLSQLGAVAAPFTERQGERLAKQRETERAIKLAAIKEGIAAETRGKAAEDKRVSEARQSLFQAASEAAGLTQREKMSVAQIKSAGATQEAIFSFNLFKQDDQQSFLDKNREDTQAFQTELTKLEDEIRRGQMELGRELDADKMRQAEDIGARNLMRRSEVQRELVRLGHDNDMAKIAQNFSNTQDLTNLRAELAEAAAERQGERNMLLQEARLQVQRDANEDLTNYRTEMLDLQERKFDLQKLAEEDRLSRLPGTESGLFGESEQEELNRINKEYQELRNQALAQGMDTEVFDSDLKRFLSLKEDSRADQLLQIRQQSALLQSAASTQEDLGYGTAAQQSTLLGDPTSIRLYSQGVTIPGFDQALTEVFGRQTVDNLGNRKPALPLTPALQAALAARKRLGLAVPNIQGFAQGGMVGIDLLDPITGLPVPSSMDPRVQRAQENIRRSAAPIEPMITKDVEDITLATGGRDALSGKIGGIVNLAANIAFGIDSGVARDVKQAQKAVETLSTVATTTLMAAIPGKDNVELQRMLKQLQVPAGTFSLQDDEALDYFKIARNTMDLGIDNQEDLIESGNLNRKEQVKVSEDLKQMNAIRAEYDNVIQAYERKEMPSEQVSRELDKFFR